MTTIIFDAIEFAAKAHRGQFRKGTKVPYIVHPLNVAKILIDCGCSEFVVAAGILHDTVEDTQVTIKDIKNKFGAEVARIVASSSEPDKSDTWESRKRHTIERIKETPMDALMVECADKLDNIRAIRDDYLRVGESIWSRFNRPKESQRWYYKGLADAFISRDPDFHLFKEFEAEVKSFFE